MGHNEVSKYAGFIGSLCRFYQGDVKLLIDQDTVPEVLQYLSANNIQTVTIDGSKYTIKKMRAGWTALCRKRYSYDREWCNGYDWCMAHNFRDVMFQSDPMGSLLDMDDLEQVDLLLYAHDIIMNKWHLGKLKECGFYNDFHEFIRNKLIINAGGFIGRPHAFAALERAVQRLSACDDQVAVNVGIYSNLLNNTRIKINKQGYGVINNVGYKGMYFLDEEKHFLGRDCLVSPVVHQFAAEVRPPENQACMKGFGN